MKDLSLGPPFNFPRSAGLFLTAQKCSFSLGKKRCPFGLLLAAFSIKINLTMKAISRQKCVRVFSKRMKMKKNQAEHSKINAKTVDLIT